MGADATVYDEIDPSVTTEFVGYDTLSCDSKITVLTTESEITEAVADGPVSYTHLDVYKRQVRRRSVLPSQEAG